MYDPYFTLKILRSSPRRHRGERTTTIPMKTPPLPVEFAVDGCLILCGGWESVPRAGSKTPPASCGGGAFEMIGGLWSRARCPAVSQKTTPGQSRCHP